MMEKTDRRELKDFPISPDRALTSRLPAFPTHGGQVRTIMRHFPDAPRPFIDLSTGINPNAYPFTMPSFHALTRLPEADEEKDLRVAAARAYGAVDPDMVVTGPGSQSLISLLPRILPASQACIWGPTYSGHDTAWKLSEKTVEQVFDGENLWQKAALPGTVCILCNPNNPDGRIAPPAPLKALADRCASYGNHLIIDEAFADFDCESLIPALPNPGLIVLRSFGKTYGLPGIRLGFLLTSPGMAERARNLVGAWPVSSIAITAGREALLDTGWLEQARMTALRAKSRLTALLDRAGLRHTGQASLFILVQTHHAVALWNHLCEHGIVSRIFPERPDTLRLGLPGDEQAWTRLEAALECWRERIITV